MLTYLKRKHTLDALKYSHNMHRVGVFGMTVVWGMLARLTWWEYSWDVMEPCTFFVTYGGAILCYSYYLGTKTNPDYDDVSKTTRVSVVQGSAEHRRYVLDGPRTIETEKTSP